MARGKNFLISLSFFLLTSCTFNPFSLHNDTTGSPIGILIGGAAGAGTVALLGGSKPLMVLAGIGGGALGYYFTTLRYESGGIIQGGGEVYVVGDTLGIYIPTDSLFAVNTTDFLPQAGPILDSVATVLKRYPNNNIVIAGNTSGFDRERYEQKLSERRAKRVADYLASKGISNFRVESNEERQFTYVGYNNYFPIANDYTNEGIRANSRIQITSYPVFHHLTQEQIEDRRAAGLTRQEIDAALANHCGGDC